MRANRSRSKESFEYVSPAWAMNCSSFAQSSHLFSILCLLCYPVLGNAGISFMDGNMIQSYSFLRAIFIICSILAHGSSFSTAEIALLTFAFVNPSSTRAVAASSAMAFVPAENKADVLLPVPLTTLSLSSSMSL